MIFFSIILTLLPGLGPEKSFLENLSYYIENPEVFELNQVDGRSYFIPETAVSLNGTWKFLYAENPAGVPKDFFAPGYNTGKWSDISVPSNWEMQGFGQPLFRNTAIPFVAEPPRVDMDVLPTGAYRRDFRIPSSWDGTEIFLRFEKVQSASFVWVNGRQVGYNEGGQEPSEYDITEYVRPGRNSVSVLVLKYSDGYYLEDQDYWRLAGIFDDVWVYSSPKTRIFDWYAVTDFDSSFTDSDLTVEVDLRSYGEDASGLKVDAVVSRGGEKVAEMCSPSGNIAAGGKNPVRMRAKVQNPEKWSAETPSLYDLEMKLSDASGCVIDRVRTRIGFKKTEIRDGVFYLNGQPVKVNAINTHMQHPVNGHTMDEATVRKDMEILKQFNFNGVRTSHYPPVNKYLELADEYGLYIIDETGDESHGTEHVCGLPEWTEMYRERARKMVLRDRNHPCVLFWSAGNESGEDFNISEVVKEGKLYDTTRFWMYGGNDEKHPAEEIVGPRYPSSFRHELQYGIDPSDKRPSFMDEYLSVAGNGGGGMAAFWREIDAHPSLLGGAIWDFVSTGMTERERVLNDSSPYGVQATIMGRAVRVDGPWGKCLDLNVTDQWVEVYRDDVLENGFDRLTLVADIFPRKHNSSGGYVITKGNNEFGLRQMGEDSLLFYIFPGRRVELKAALPADWSGRWHRISGVYDGEKMSIYIDGIRSASVEVSGRIENLPWPVNVGRDMQMCGQETSEYICDAKMDNVGIFADAILPEDGYEPAKSVLWLDFETETSGEEYFSYGIGARTYGAIWPDRVPQPEMWEYKHCTQPLVFDLLDADGGYVEVWNRNFFTAPSAYKTTWSLTCDDQVLESGELNIGGLEPRGKRVYRIPYTKPALCESGKEYRLEISSVTRDVSLWAPAGHEVAWGQFELNDWNIPSKIPAPSGKVAVLSESSGITVSGEGFVYRFDPVTGALVSMCAAGKEMITGPLKLNVWRAPLANESDGWCGWQFCQKGGESDYGDWLSSLYYSAGLDSMTFVPVNVAARQAGGCVVIDVRELVTLKTADTGFENSYRYVIDGDGLIVIRHSVNPQGKMPLWLPRIGLTLSLDCSLANVGWYGRGPQENYPDRKSGYRVGIWESSVEDMYEPYLIPQDHGLRCDCRWMRLTDGDGCGIEVSCDRMFNFNVSEYSSGNLTRAIYQYQLKKAGYVTLNVDYATSGVGCTANGIDTGYRVYPELYERTVIIRPVFR